MKIKPTTLFLVLAALLLGGVTLFVAHTQDPASEQTETNERQPIFSFKEDQVQSFTLETQSQFFRFERNGEGVWQMQEPEQTTANDASIAFLLNLVATGESTRSISIPDADRSDFGLDEPLATLELTLDNQEKHTLILGGYDFNRTSLYAIADPPENPDGENTNEDDADGNSADGNSANANSANEDLEDLTVLLVSPNFENAVSRPIEEWKQLPETTTSPSPSPSPNSSASPSASPSPSSSPSAEASDADSSDADSEESPSP